MWWRRISGPDRWCLERGSTWKFLGQPGGFWLTFELKPNDGSNADRFAQCIDGIGIHWTTQRSAAEGIYPKEWWKLNEQLSGGPTALIQPSEEDLDMVTRLTASIAARWNCHDNSTKIYSKSKKWYCFIKAETDDQRNHTFLSNTNSKACKILWPREPKEAAEILRDDKRRTASKTKDGVQKSKKDHKLLIDASLRRPG
jgi:hypothetical protein